MKRTRGSELTHHRMNDTHNQEEASPCGHKQGTQLAILALFVDKNPDPASQTTRIWGAKPFDPAEQAVIRTVQSQPNHSSPPLHQTSPISNNARHPASGSLFPFPTETPAILVQLPSKPA